MSFSKLGSFATGLLVVVLASNVLAVEPDGQPVSSAGNQPTSSPDEPNGSIWERDQMLGDMGGLRPWLGKTGITLDLTETSEVLGNTSGGVKRSFEYDGLTTLTLQMDTQRAFGWEGGTFNVSGLNIHGTNLSSKNLMNLQTASGIQSDNGFRLWEAWYQQSFWNDQADVKIGQQSIDQEFIVSDNALLYVNTMFGWPMVPSADLIGGGPAYPLSSPGLRLRVKPSDSWTVLGGVFNDNPAGLGPTSTQNPQSLNQHGLNFRLNDSPLFIAEVQYSYPALSEREHGGKNVLPGTYRLGGWYDGGRFADQHIGTDGLSLATGNGNPRLHRGNYSLYAVADQMIWRDSVEDKKSVSFFTRIMGTPQADRNNIDFSLNAGFNFNAPFAGRDDDVFGLGMGYAHVSGEAADLDVDSGTIRQSGETFIELTYQYAVTPWWALQPDLQYVFNTGGGVANPTGGRIGNETIMGVRTNISF